MLTRSSAFVIISTALPLVPVACSSATESSSSSGASTQAIESAHSRGDWERHPGAGQNGEPSEADDDDDGSSDDGGTDAGPHLVSAVAPYAIRVWAAAPSDATSLDAIESDGSHLWAAYQNNTTKDGSDGGPGAVLNSTIIEYSVPGATPLHRYALAGHVDGLRVDPATGLIWATSNEDGDPHLFRINPRTTSVDEIALPPVPQGGGLDDLGFIKGKMFVAASSPQNNPNMDPALLEVVVTGNSAAFSPALLGNEAAKDYNTGASVALNLQDPDSISITPHDELVLSSQDDKQLVFVKDPGSGARTVRLLDVADKIDDTVWATEEHGRLLVADGNSNIIFSIRKRGGFHEGDVYTEVDHHAVVAPVVGRLDLVTGTITTIASGPALTNPTGLLFMSHR